MQIPWVVRHWVECAGSTLHILYGPRVRVTDKCIFLGWV